jgi:hypothetical protein
MDAITAAALATNSVGKHGVLVDTSRRKSGLSHLITLTSKAHAEPVVEQLQTAKNIVWPGRIGIMRG